MVAAEHVLTVWCVCEHVVCLVYAGIDHVLQPAAYVHHIVCFDTQTHWLLCAETTFNHVATSHLQGFMMFDCMQSKKKERAELNSSLKNRVHISEAIMEYLMQGPLREGQSPALHCQASDVLQSLCHLKLSLEKSS